MLDTPILFLIFNRPDTTERVFERIKQAKPKQLFIAADGPRKSVHNEMQLCDKTRAIISKIDWRCEVKTLFRDENLGCGKAVSQAISWFFEHVEEGIILEDDCLPHPSFFTFCSIMLEKYRNEPTVWQISGTNFLFGQRPNQYNYTYYFSAYSAIWGWATWKRCWKDFTLNIPDWRINIPNLLSERIKSSEMQNWILKMYLANESKSMDTWDIQWSYHFHNENGLSITPINNLIQNIGIHGSHFSHRTPFHNMQTKTISFDNLYMSKINPPLSIQHEIDTIAFENILKRKLPLIRRVLTKIKRIFKI